MLKLTIAELAAKMGIEYVVASALVKLLVSRGAGKEVEKRPAPGGKGKPSTVYELPASYNLVLSKEEEKVAA